MEVQPAKPKSSPKDFFLNLGAVILLYTGVINILNLIFAIIDKAVPDPAVYYSYTSVSSEMRWAVAVLIITYPLYIYFTNILNKDIALDPEKKNIGVRKWLTYLTLFIAGTTITVDLVVLLNAFLGGELTTKFLMKIIAVLVVLLLVLQYYLLNLKENYSCNKRIFLTATLIIILSIAGGFYEMGSPATQRMIRFDETRVSDLQNIQWQIVNYWQQKNAIPEKLENLNDTISGFTIPLDPETGEYYEYNITGATNFSLCATFGLESVSENSLVRVPVSPISESNAKTETWSHGSGKKCFDRTIDVELYSIKK